MYQEVLVRRGDGDGGFASAQSFPTTPSSGRVSLVDWNGDGALDLIAPEAPSESVYIGRGDGAGGFVPPDWRFIGGPARAVAVGDLDGDGQLDMAACSRLGVHPRTAAQDLLAGPLPAGRLPESLAISGLDGDGAADIVVATRMVGWIWSSWTRSPWPVTRTSSSCSSTAQREHERLGRSGAVV